MVDPEIIHGKPVIAGTRIPVALVLGQLAGGVTFEELDRAWVVCVSVMGIEILSNGSCVL